jgi:hypothetical protein
VPAGTVPGGPAQPPLVSPTSGSGPSSRERVNPPSRRSRLIIALDRNHRPREESPTEVPRREPVSARQALPEHRGT